MNPEPTAADIDWLRREQEEADAYEGVSASDARTHWSEQ